MDKNKKEMVSYTAVLLNERSQKKLKEYFSEYIPEDWKLYCHHMTINLGEINEKYEKYLGFNVQLQVTHIGKSDKAIAVKVIGFPSENKTPHITLAVNINEGGKPKMSNDITEWEQVNNITIQGKVEEVKF